ncbi:MAG: hypothetical protein HZB29_10680 [Nitrospinae bacterium]|nr:hypothetical protein [Nitrospinota bacterium]
MNDNWVFINIPYDARYERLYLALISGLTALGLTPRCTLEVPPDKDRLKRIFHLINKCKYSIHDLSRVQLSGKKERLPRFNMPFEAGLSAALMLNKSKHSSRILESKCARPAAWK